ncbi:PAS domain-containing protein [Acidobacteriota bacterium]
MSVNNQMDIKESLAEIAQKISPFDLPIGVYVVTQAGDFVECNARAREILKLPPTGKEINANIVDFYCDRTDRIRLLKELEDAKTEERFLEKRIQFMVNSEKIWVQDYCRSVKDPDTGEIIGYTGCLIDVTEEESSRQLFEKLPVGVYTLDSENKIVRVNQASANILGYNDPSELEGKTIEELYTDKEEAKKFDKLIMDEGSVVNEIVQLNKKKGEPCYLSVCAYKKTDINGKTYIGREGTIMDVSKEEYYRKLRNTIPVGTYMLRKNENGKEIIQQCNNAFADMFGYSTEEIKRIEVKDLYATEKDYKEFLKDIKEKNTQNGIIEGIPIRAKKANGRILTLEVHCRIFTDSSGNTLGRAGVVLDISNEIALRELRGDIGKVLHFYSATLVTLDQSIKSILSALAPDPFAKDEVLTIDKAIAALSDPAKNLKNTLYKMLELRKSEPERHKALPGKKWSTLENQKQLLEEYETQIPYPEFQLATLHELSKIILNVHGEIEKGKLPRELTRDVYTKARELERICCLIRTHQTLDTIIEVDYSIRALREYIIFQRRPPETDKVCDIITLIQNAVFDLYLFAKHKRVDIKQDYESCKARVKVEERSVLRALSNLLYNAIKYSWSREIGRKPWVDVKAFTVGGMVHVEFQNFGVPITQEEIEEELVFNFGYRGQFSGDRRRMGTGVGLSDARDTARKYGGDVILTSQPASGEDETNYNQPFVTKATLKLPRY